MNGDIEAELRKIFREEARETLDSLRLVFGRLRGSEEVSRSSSEVTDALRFSHNLKGAAASVGLTAAAALAHSLEELLLSFRDSPEVDTASCLSLFDDASSALEAACEERDAARVAEVTELLNARVRALRQEQPASATGETAVGDEAAAGPEESAADELAAVEVVSALGVSEGSTLRVEAARLDRLFEFASELLVTGTQMQQRHDALESLRDALKAAWPDGAGRGAAEVGGVLRRFDAFVDDHYKAASAFARLSPRLSAAMRSARMVPLRSLAPWLRRVVDDAARQSGKPVDLELGLATIELDRAVIDRLKDPLLHLVRNAVDHGIDSAEDRELFGKADRGLISITAAVRGQTVRLTVADDGRGIDARALEGALIAKGIVTAEEAARLDEPSLMAFVFAEGFSTRTQTTMLSGRGVGLDVVRRAVVELGGNATVEPRGPLGGAAFHLTVPLSILSTSLLLVRASGVVYGLPSHAVDHVTSIPRTAIRELGDLPVAELPDRDPLPLRWLSRLLGQRVESTPETLPIVTLGEGGSAMALAVDEVMHEANLVVRKLPWNLVDVPGVSGAVAMPDGTVAVVLDAAALLAGRGKAVVGSTASAAPSSLRVLVADDSMTTRTVHKNVLVGAGYEVVLAADGNEAWQRLREERVDLVVSDVQMPGIDGFELTRRIRADAKLGGLPVVLVTSLAKPDDIQRGLNAGADEYVVKGPLEQDALLAAVKRHIG